MSLMKRKMKFKKQKHFTQNFWIKHGINFPIKIIKITTVIILKKNIRKKVITFYKTKIKKQEAFFV